MLVLVSVLRIWFQLGGCESTRFVNILHCRLKTFVCVCMYLCMYNVYESISVSYLFVMLFLFYFGCCDKEISPFAGQLKEF